MRNLVIIGGISHPFAAAGAELAAMLAPHGIASELTEDVEAGLARVARGEFDLTDTLTAWAAFGGRQGKEANVLANPNVDAGEKRANGNAY